MATPKTASSVPPLGIIIVAYGHDKEIGEQLDRIATQKLPRDYVIVVDNHPSEASAVIARKHVAADLVLTTNNVGFSEGCNLAAKEMPGHIKLLLLLNPDALPDRNALIKVRAGKPEWGGWMGLLVMPGHRVNSAGNILHMSGLCWCDGYDRSVDDYKEDGETVILSGACMVVRRMLWDELGGFGEDYFTYYEDTDLSVRILMGGHGLGVISEAKFIHDYDFYKSKSKWYYIERNRYIFMCRNWPGTILIIMAPFLVLTEVGLWGISILERRFVLRLKSVFSFLQLLPKLLIQRRSVQASRKVSTVTFMSWLEPSIETPLLGAMNNPFTNNIMKAYFLAASFIIKKLKSTRA